MNNFCKRIKAFTMAEVMVVMAIIGIISLALYGTMKAQTNYATKYQYYQALMNLKQATGEILAEGYTLSGSPAVTKAIPTVASNATANATTPVGFCDRLIQIINLIGTTSCGTTATTSPFSGTPNFITSNGQRYFFGNSAPPYTIYIDINGPKGDALSTGSTPDVQPFIVNGDGTVFPVSTSVGATSTNYLAASVQYRDNSGNIVVVERGVTYYQAACDASSDSKYNGVACTRVNGAACATNMCDILIDKPGF